MIITIDGPIATGKSSIAKLLASEIGYIYFDTGGMYRSVAYGLMKKGISPDDQAAVAAYLSDNFRLDVKIKINDRRYLVNGVDVTDEIRSPEVTAIVSQVSALAPVRENLVHLQQKLAKGVNSIFEGRDMGTVVFPNADLKIFLTGKAELRAKRRYNELKKKFPDKMKEVTLEQVLADINMRDKLDSERKLSPLVKAEDAYEIDTSNLSEEDVVAKILEIRSSHKRPVRSAAAS